MQQTFISLIRTLVLILVVTACGQKEDTRDTARNRTVETPSTPARGSGIFGSQEQQTQRTDRQPLWGDNQAAARFGSGHFPRPIKKYGQELTLPTPLRTIPVNQTVTLPVVVKNIGAATWVGKSNPAARHIMMLAYHWIDGPTTRSLRANSEIADSARRRTPRVISTNTLRAHGKVIVYEGIRTPLGDDLLPGGSATINAAIQAPAQPGNFTLRLTMLEDQVVWFDERGAVPLDLLVTVTAQ